MEEYDAVKKRVKKTVKKVLRERFRYLHIWRTPSDVFRNAHRVPENMRRISRACKCRKETHWRSWGRDKTGAHHIMSYRTSCDAFFRGGNKVNCHWEGDKTGDSGMGGLISIQVQEDWPTALLRRLTKSEPLTVLGLYPFFTLIIVYTDWESRQCFLHWMPD